MTCILSFVSNRALEGGTDGAEVLLPFQAMILFGLAGLPSLPLFLGLIGS